MFWNTPRTPSKKNHHKFLDSQQQYSWIDNRQSRNCKSRCGLLPFSFVFTKQTHSSPPRNWKNYGRRKHYSKKSFGETKFRERMDLAPITNAHAPSGTAYCARGWLPVPEVCPCFDPSSKNFPYHVHSLIPFPDLPPSSPLLLLPLACHSPPPLLRCLLRSSFCCCSWAFFWSLSFPSFFASGDHRHKRNEPNLTIDLTIK